MKALPMLVGVVALQGVATTALLLDRGTVHATDVPMPVVSSDDVTDAKLENFAALTVDQDDGSQALVVFSKVKNMIEKDGLGERSYITSMAVYDVDTLTRSPKDSAIVHKGTRYLDYDLAFTTERDSVDVVQTKGSLDKYWKAEPEKPGRGK